MMGADEDIARALPDPPPPRPVRREATLAMALRRFDARDGAAVDVAAASPRRSRIGRPQLSVLASAALVAVIAVPVMMRALDDGPAPVERAAPSAPASDLAAADPHEIPRPAARRADTAPPATAGRPERTEAPSVSVPSPIRVPEQDVASRDATASLLAPPSVVAAAPPAPPPPAPPPPPAAMAAPNAVDANDVVVTAQRRSAPSRSDGGDAWTRCTVDDPAHNLEACTRQLDPAASGRAAAPLADGLLRAWEGDTDGAIAAFDRAIALEPRAALGYLNRGLAYRRAGNLDRALADLDLAVRHDRSAARGYHARSLVRGERGDRRGSETDRKRAESIDQR